MSATPTPAVRQARAFLQWLGLPGVVLAAALLCDLMIIGSASLDDIGPRGTDLLLLPGILALSACALWGRSQPVAAAWAGSGVLVASTVVIRAYSATPYSTLLPNISFAEFVAGLELVFFCVQAARGGIVFVTTLALTTAGFLAVAGREPVRSTSSLVQALVTGFVLLAITVAVATQLRQPVPERARSELVTLVRQQWLLVGALALVLFLDTYLAAVSGVMGLFVLATAIGAATATVFATRYPVQSGVALAGILFLGALAVNAADRTSYSQFGGFPVTQVIAGMAVTVLLVRSASSRRAAQVIALLTVVVASGAIANTPVGDMSSLRGLFVAALLLLGIAVATGLFLRARDSERTRVVESAVSEAQTAERMALARELHDVVAHHVTGIVVQAQAARMLAEQNPRIVADALDQIERAGTDALSAMRRLVRSMRGDLPSGATEFSEQATTDLAADLRRLIEAGNHGVPTETDLDLPDWLPQEVARSALRLVQEALTNVGKHAAGATRATVSARVAGDELHIRVSDDGRQQRDRAPGGSAGYGLIGMRERVELLRGRLSAGQGPGGGWVVEAWLPVGEAEKE